MNYQLIITGLLSLAILQQLFVDLKSSGSAEVVLKLQAEAKAAVDRAAAHEGAITAHANEVAQLTAATKARQDRSDTTHAAVVAALRADVKAAEKQAKLTHGQAYKALADEVAKMKDATKKAQILEAGEGCDGSNAAEPTDSSNFSTTRGVAYFRSIAADTPLPGAESGPAAAVDGDLSSMQESATFWQITFAVPVRLSRVEIAMRPASIFVDLLREEGCRHQSVFTEVVNHTLLEVLPGYGLLSEFVRVTVPKYVGPIDALKIGRMGETQPTLSIAEVLLFDDAGLPLALQQKTKPKDERLARKRAKVAQGRCRAPKSALKISSVKMTMSALRVLSVAPDVTCVFITALFGPIEKTLKPILPQKTPCAQFAFTDRRWTPRNKFSSAGWTVVTDPLYLADPRLTLQSHSFQKAKFFKQQFHLLLPPHVAYAFWVDSTVKFTNASATETMIDLLQHRSSVISAVHDAPTVLDEVIRSFFKYSLVFTTWPFLATMYLQYVAAGFCEFSWRTLNAERVQASEYELIRLMEHAYCKPPYTEATADFAMQRVRDALRVAKAKPRCPLSGQFGDIEALSPFLSARQSTAALPTYTTCLVGFDMSIPAMKHFLDWWYANTFHHWQDQASFPVALWWFGLRAEVVNWSSMFVKLPHGR